MEQIVDQSIKSNTWPQFVRLQGQGYKQTDRNIHIPSINLSVESQTLIQSNNPLKIIWKQKYGLVGKNGTGKSVLIRTIRDRAQEFSIIPPYLSMYLVEQEIPAAVDKTALDWVLESNREMQWLILMKDKLELNPDLEDEVDWDLDDIEERLDELQSYRASADATNILLGLGFDKDDIQSKKITSYSGGWRMRIALASALFQKPDLLLLDEPTNHLDIPAVIWLEYFLSKYPHTLLIISHDKDFLNSIVNNIIELDSYKLTEYKGNYDSYQKEKLEKERLDSKKKKEEEKKKKSVPKHPTQKKEKNIPKKKYVNTQRWTCDDPNIDTDQNKITNPPIKHYNTKPIEFNFEKSNNLGEAAIIQIQDVVFCYGDIEAPPLFNPINTGIYMDSRIGLVGANGTGKSTLIQMIRGRLKPTSGYIWKNDHLIVSYFSQHHVDNFKNIDMTPVEYFESKYTTSKNPIRHFLARFGLRGDLPVRKISSLSGGQKTCLALADVAWTTPHLLLLDEPTNHLDMSGIESLIQGLKNFNGSIILISHNQYIIEAVTREIWIVDKNSESNISTVHRFEGTFADYKQKIIQQIEDMVQE